MRCSSSRRAATGARGAHVSREPNRAVRGSSFMTHLTESVLTDEMLARFAKRAPQYDRDNVFFTDDFDELRQAGYLRLAVPTELGGGGLSLAGVAQHQRRLGYYAAPTALAVNMHLYWTGIAADLWRAGDRSQRWLLGGRDRQVSPPATPRAATTFRCCCRRPGAARRGGYRFTGASPSAVSRRSGPISVFTAWIRVIRRTEVVHAFMPRDTEATHRADLGTCSAARDAQRRHDSRRVFVPDRFVVRVVPRGGWHRFAFVLAIFAWAWSASQHLYGLASRARSHDQRR